MHNFQKSLKIKDPLQDTVIQQLEEELNRTHQKLTKAELAITHLNNFKESQMDLLSGFEVSLEAKEEELAALRKTQVRLMNDLEIV